MKSINLKHDSNCVVYEGELCKIKEIKYDENLEDYWIEVHNLHRDEPMALLNEQVRSPEPGEFCKSSTLNGEGESKGPKIVFKLED